MADSNDDDKTYYCEEHRPSGWHPMMATYTPLDILEMRRRGRVIRVTGPAESPSSVRMQVLPPQQEHEHVRGGTPYHEALLACARLYTYAEDSKNDELKERAERALRELLRGSGVGEPTTEQRIRAVLTLPPEVTFPGVGPRR